MTIETEDPAPVSAANTEAEASASVRSNGASNDIVLISRHVLNYFIVALVFTGVGMVLGISIAKSNDPSASMIATAVVQAVNSSNVGRAAATPGPAPLVDVSVDDDPAWGPVDASVVIVEFSDFQCPYCERFHRETYPRLRAAYEGKIRFVFRDLPLTQIHPDAMLAALAAECANEQDAFWDYHDVLFANQDDLSRDALGRYAGELELDMTRFNTCLDSERYQDEVSADMQDAAGYGIQGTPTFFINGRPLVGSQPFEVFAAAIDKALAETAVGS
jgi:protein-disulfide isomerase